MLMEFNKGHWVTAREDFVHAKGKDELQTWWLNVNMAEKSSRGGTSIADTSTADAESTLLETDEIDELAEKLHSRLSL